MPIYFYSNENARHFLCPSKRDIPYLNRTKTRQAHQSKRLGHGRKGLLKGQTIESRVKIIPLLSPQTNEYEQNKDSNTTYWDSNTAPRTRSPNECSKRVNFFPNSFKQYRPT